VISNECNTGVYVKNLDAHLVQTARDLGIKIKERGPRVELSGKRLPKAWKPGLFTIDIEGKQSTIRGFVRGSLAIDYRSVEIKGYVGCTYQGMRWCLTHVPSGGRIATQKYRSHTEELADKLRESVPELTDGDAEITAEIKSRARSVVDEFFK